MENRIFIVTANRIGTEKRTQNNSLNFIGQSQVVDPDGDVLCRASDKKEETKVVDIDIEKSRNKYINPRDDLFTDRRPDLYRL